MKITHSSNAKINLGLIIKGKRQSDGYHLIETLYYPVDLADELVVETQEEKTCTVVMHGFDEKLAPENNLIYKAWEVFSKRYPDKVGGIKVEVTKNIPAGSGLGGGSSNAAFTLKGINDLYQVNLEVESLAKLAAPLGADVPFFIYNRPLFARGIGNEFEEYTHKVPFRVKIVTSEIHSSTKEAYDNLDWKMMDESTSLLKILGEPFSEWKTCLRNDLEESVFKKYPELGEIKESLYREGAIYAAMSGSGSAVFGLFEK